jgi:dihydroneopterin aldolase
VARVDVIRIVGLREMGVHGALPEERSRPQPFEVDVELEVDLRAAGASDDLEDTVDYGAVCEAVARVVSSESFQLLERLASRIADMCLADPRVQCASVEVRKLHPPVRTAVAYTAVRVERRAGE